LTGGKRGVRKKVGQNTKEKVKKKLPTRVTGLRTAQNEEIMGKKQRERKPWWKGGD